MASAIGVVGSMCWLVDVKSNAASAALTTTRIAIGSSLSFGIGRVGVLNRPILCTPSPNSNIISSSPDSSNYYIPDSNFYKVEAILRPWRIQQVSSALLKMGIRGITVSDVRGFGAQGASTERHAGSEFSQDNLVAKVKMEIVVAKHQVEAVMDKIIDQSRTGEIGDGKIFLIPVSDIIRVRTGERGEKAERMAGGWADIISNGAST